MPNWNKHYVVDIAVLLALTFLTTIYSHPLLPTCHPEQRRRIPWKGTLWKIDCVQQYTTDVHNVSVPGDVSTALRSAQHDRQRRFCKFVFYACSLLINRLCVAYCYKPFANLAHEPMEPPFGGEPTETGVAYVARLVGTSRHISLIFTIYYSSK